MAACLSGPAQKIKKPHMNWGRASAHQLQRVPADSERETMGMGNYAGEASERREICRAFDKAPHIPTAGAPTASPFNKKSQADALFWRPRLPCARRMFTPGTRL